MKIAIVKIQQTVTKCRDCFHCKSSMDGPYCDVLETRDGAYKGMLSDTSTIPNNCPFLVKEY